MMLHVPGQIEQSMFSENLVEFVDILPTLVDAAGLPTLEKCPQYSRNISICREGTSLLSIPDGGSWKEAIFYQQPRGYWCHDESWCEYYQGYSVLTPQYRSVSVKQVLRNIFHILLARYSEYVMLKNLNEETQEPDWSNVRDWGELFDLFSDPEETVNLFRNQEYDEVREMLSGILHDGWTKYN